MRWVLVLASCYGFTGVMLGAFGAHGLVARLTPAQLASYETGVRYQLIHAVLLLAIGLWQRHAPAPLLTAAATAVALGVALFSLSIYLLATRELTGLANGRWLGPVTPLGGLLLLVGWACLVAHAFRMKA